MKIVRLRVPEGRDITQALTDVIDRSATDERILEVQPNFVFETAQAAVGAMKFSVPQYATEKVRLGEAHRIALGRNVRVAVIDTGLDDAHPELTGVSIETFDAIGEGSPTSEAHGTAVAGIVAARQQIRGMAPDARVLAVRAFAAGSGQRPEATTLSIINGIHWAIANGARVINMSFVGPKDALLQRAIEAGIAKGVIFVAAAGNGGPSAAQAYPAAYSGVIAVTAIDSNDQLYGMANRGDYIALAAPGVDILAPAPNSAYEMSSGTSLAAAHVSGIIALMLSSEEARDILKRTARDPGQTAMANGLGAGIIDAARAVAEIR
jgi:subtilisin family serine protease